MWVSRAAAVHGQDGRRHVLHPLDAHRGDQSRAGHLATCRPATRSPAGRASARGRRYGLGSLNENLPTFVVLVAKPTQHGAGPGHLGAALVERAICPANTRACRFRSGGDPILFINNPAGRASEVRRTTLDGLKALNELNYQQRRRPGNAHAHSAVRDGLPHASERAGTDRSRARSRRARIELYGEDAKKPGTLRQHGADGPPAGRARRALRADLSQQLGHARQRRRTPARASATTSTSPATA